MIENPKVGQRVFAGVGERPGEIVDLFPNAQSPRHAVVLMDDTRSRVVMPLRFVAAEKLEQEESE